MNCSSARNHLGRALALALEARPLDEDARADVLGTLACPGSEHFAQLLEGARAVRRKFFRNELHLCAIANAKSGGCTEDCAFCAQSARHKTASPRHGFLDPKKIAADAAQMKARGASRFGIVASGLELDRGDFDLLLKAVELVAATGLKADVSVGLLTPERLSQLVDAGLSGVHHNLEVAESFFPQVCTTHSYAEDLEAVRLAVAAGLFVCSGGIFGLGESWAQRAELADTLRGLGVSNVPINFLVPIAGTRMEGRPVLCHDEALGILALFRILMPRANLRVCGGRGAVFGPPGGQGQRRLFDSAASGLMIGDYLTVAGTPAQADLDLARELGLAVVPAAGGAASGPQGNGG